MYMCIWAHTHTHTKKFIIRNWLTQLWQLTRPKICSRQAGDPWDPWYSSRTKNPRTRRASGLSSRLKASRLETQEKLILQSESGGQKGPISQHNSSAGRILSYLLGGGVAGWQHFCSRQTWSDEGLPLGEWGGIPLCVLPKHSQRHTQNKVAPNIWVPP